MEAHAIFERATGRFAAAVHSFQPASGGVRDPFFKVDAATLPEMMRWLRDDPELRFDFLQNLTAVDWPRESLLQSVYHLHSYPHRHELCVKVDLPRADPRVPSVAALWKNAEWLEREQYDLLGVLYDGHPDLRRLLMPDDWVGHPMRKDYREPSEYRGMPTTRVSPLTLLKSYDGRATTKVDPTS